LIGLTAGLFLLVGMHVPKAFTLLYLALLLCAIQVRESHQSDIAIKPAYWRWSLVCLFLFSVIYLGIMLYWGLVSPHGSSLLDCISALVLPAGCFWVGLRLPLLGRGSVTNVLLAYALGGLLYVIAALFVARHPWWALDPFFPTDMPTPWGVPNVVNVRSIEQNGILALAMLPSALLLSVKPEVPARVGAFLMGGAALLGLHVVLSLNGRLGFVALFLAVMPLLPVGWQARNSLRRWLLAAGSGSIVAIFCIVRKHPSFGRLMSGGFCDERFNLYAGFLQRLGQGLFGGHKIVVSSIRQCDSALVFSFNAGVPGSLLAVHNVALDIYNDAGFLPVLLLLLALVPPLVSIVQGFWSLSIKGQWDWQWFVRWGWFVILAIQWLFNPLLYGDGLLYYLSFFVLGLLAAEFALVRSKGNAELPLDNKFLA